MNNNNIIRTIQYNEIVHAIKNLIIATSTNLPNDALVGLQKAYENEISQVSKEVLRQILENANIAKQEQRPLCQDTGLAVFFVELGQNVHVEGGNIKDAINEGTELGYKEGYLRASTCDAFSRANLQNTTGYNLPAVIHFDITQGNLVKIGYAAKGGGSENVSRATVLAPAAGKEGVIEFVKQVISEAGPNPCPPLIVGIGIGGSFEQCAIASKHALFRDIGTKNHDTEMGILEEQILLKLNNLGIGAMGMGGTQTVMAVHIEKNPCHIASLPVSVNVQCHSSRHAHIII